MLHARGVLVIFFLFLDVLLGYQDCTLYMNDSFCLNSPGYSFAGDDDACIVAAVWYGVSGYHGVGCFILLGFHLIYVFLYFSDRGSCLMQRLGIML